jgi:hypothetical protein
MPLREDERLIQLRLLAQRLEAGPPSRGRDALLARTRLRIVEAEAGEDLDPPSSHPALRGELT